MNVHKTLRSEIEACTTGKDCVQVYNNPFFQACLEAFRQAQDQFLEERSFILGVDSRDHEEEGTLNSEDQNLVEEWAKQWARGVSSHQEWSKLLEDCRKTTFLLLKKVCDLWNWCSLVDQQRPEDKQVIEEFQKRRIHQIMWYTLVLDRANALYHMPIDNTVVKKVRGLCWYSAYDDGEDNDGSPRAMAQMPKNSFKPAMNRRYVWLYEVLYTADENKAFAKWMQIAFPPRLGTPENMNSQLFQEELQEARKSKMKEEIANIQAAQKEALQQVQQVFSWTGSHSSN